MYQLLSCTRLHAGIRCHVRYHVQSTFFGPVPVALALPVDSGQPHFRSSADQSRHERQPTAARWMASCEIDHRLVSLMMMPRPSECDWTFVQRVVGLRNAFRHELSFRAIQSSPISQDSSIIKCTISPQRSDRRTHERTVAKWQSATFSFESCLSSEVGRRRRRDRPNTSQAMAWEHAVTWSSCWSV